MSGGYSILIKISIISIIVWHFIMIDIQILIINSLVIMIMHLRVNIDTNIGLIAILVSTFEKIVRLFCFCNKLSWNF